MKRKTDDEGNKSEKREGEKAKQVLDLLKGDAEQTYKNYEVMLNERYDGSVVDENEPGLARELAPDIKVNAVAPGAMLEPPDVTWTDEQKNKVIENVPLKRMGSEKDIAETVKFLAHSEYITGQIIKVDGGRSL